MSTPAPFTTAPAAGRTVVFKVSGNIELASNLTLDKPRVTVAGQTAPGGGVCLKNHTLRLDADDVQRALDERDARIADLESRLKALQRQAQD